MKYARWFVANANGIWLNVLLRILSGLVQTALSLMVVWLSKRLIDAATTSNSDENMTMMACMIAVAVVSGVGLRQLNQYLANKAMIRKVARLRLSLFGKLFRQRLFADQPLHSGDVTSRMAKDIDTVSETLAVTIPQVIETSVKLIGAFLLMRWFDSRLAWAIVLITPIAIIIGKFLSHTLRHITLRIREDESRILAKIQESIELNAVLRSLQGERWMQDRVEELQDSQTANFIHRSRVMAISRFALGCTFGLGYMLAFVWGAYRLHSGAITFGVMTSFLQLVGQIQQPILTLIGALPSIIYSTASIDRLEEIVQAEEELSANSESFNGVAPIGIRMDDVSFHYAKGDREVVDHFTHDFQPGSKTVILGTTGAGKTTLFRLILSFVSPNNGKVTFYSDGVSHVADRSMRAHVVFVPQGNTLISGTIRNNLLVAKPDASEEELRLALHTACADFVFDLPQRLDTVLAEHGGGLSEGQSQRIAIARGLLRPGSVLLLDEISSALDEATEKELFSRLIHSRPDTTMLLITHRPNVASLCKERVMIG